MVLFYIALTLPLIAFAIGAILVFVFAPDEGRDASVFSAVVIFWLLTRSENK